MDEEGSSSTTMEPIMFVLPYLAVFDLLTMAQVCKSLRAAVEDDLLPWLRMIVDTPLSFRISDYALVHLLAPRAKRRLQVLALINCINITNDALFTIALENPHITKLHIPGCTNLSPESVITAVKLLTKNNSLQSLKINGLNGLQKEHLYTLRNLIDWYQTDKILYHEYMRLSCPDFLKTDCPIDVDVCPICNQVRMVFDCPRLLCPKQQKEYCKGCESCITRCIECGVCISSSEEQDEALCQDTLCSNCWLRLPKCNFCNKPYCSNHVGQKHSLVGLVGFLCDACFTTYSNVD